jgi:pyridoxine 4-dehydrogenase
MTSPISAALSGTFNRFNLVDRASESVLDYCAAHGIGFIPSLAWILRRSSVMLPIPGTSKLPHLEDNVAAAAVELSDADFAALDSGGRTGR